MENQADTPSKEFSKEDTEVLQGQKKVLDITNHQGNANQNHNKMITSHLLECLSSKYKRASVDKGVEKRNPCALGWGCKLAQSLWKTARKFLNH